METIKLDKKTCNELLKRYVDLGYQKAGCFTIGDAANLHRNLNLLTEVEQDETVTDKQIYQQLFKAIEIANSKGAYNINDGAVIFRLVAYVNSDILAEGDSVNTELAAPAQKIEEL